MLIAPKLKLQNKGNSEPDAALIEAHHRVKNTIQNIISYVNIMFAERDTITKEDIKKLTRYLYALSTIHDLLLEEVKVSGDGTRIRLDRVIADLIQVRSVEEHIQCNDLPLIFSNARQAATLSLILSELIDNVFRHGQGGATIGVEDPGDGVALITIRNLFVQDHEIIVQKNNGLRLCELLAKSELGTSLRILKGKDIFSVMLQFPIAPLIKDVSST